MGRVEGQADQSRPSRHPWLLGIGGCILLLGIVLILLVVLMLAGIGISIDQHLASSKSKYQQTYVYGNKAATDKIAIIPIRGIIMQVSGVNGPGTVTQVEQMLAIARKDHHIKGLILDVDSPGGGVTASDRIYHELMLYKQQEKEPIVAMFGDVAASGGYYVSMAADKIVARPTTLTGSIGVIAHFYDVHRLLHTIGVQVNTIKSLTYQGKVSMKDIGSPYRAMKPKERRLLQGIITQMWERFTHIVATGRKGKLTLAQVQRIADGRVFTGVDALKAKLVDVVGYREDAFALARKLAHAPGAKIVRFRRPSSLAQLIGVDTRVHPPDAMGLLNRFTQTSPSFLYLWTGH